MNLTAVGYRSELQLLFPDRVNNPSIHSLNKQSNTIFNAAYISVIHTHTHTHRHTHTHTHRDTHTDTHTHTQMINDGYL